MTPTDRIKAVVEEARRLRGEATPGPWRLEMEDSGMQNGVAIGATVMPPKPFTGPPVAYIGSTARNAAFIVHSRNVPLEEALGMAVDALKKLTRDHPMEGRGFKGNAELPGAEEFYRGYNAGMESQFSYSEKLALAALSRIADLLDPQGAK